MKTIFRLLFVPLALLTLAGCGTFLNAVQTVGTAVSTSTANPITPAVRQKAHLTYEVLLTAAVSYRSMRQCKASEAAFPANDCYRRSIVVDMQVANRKVAAALASLDNWAVAHPTLDGSAYLSAFMVAVGQYKAIFKQAGATLPPTAL